ncbi:MAG: hypothetical protein PPP58_02245 [Natronomonas sp.]
MCRRWTQRDRTEDEQLKTDEQTEEDERPSFLNEERSADTELVTDGGEGE